MRYATRAETGTKTRAIHVNDLDITSRRCGTEVTGRNGEDGVGGGAGLLGGLHRGDDVAGGGAHFKGPIKLAASGGGVLASGQREHFRGYCSQHTASGV